MTPRQLAAVIEMEERDYSNRLSDMAVMTRVSQNGSKEQFESYIKELQRFGRS